MAETKEQRAARDARAKAAKAAAAADGADQTVTLTKDELTAMVQANVQKWLDDHPPVAEAPQAPGPVRTFENPPEELFENFEYAGAPDEFERIIVQVSEDDVKAGRHKVFDLKKEGWVVEKTFLDGVIVRMKMPREQLAKLRKGREDQYLGYLRGLGKSAPANPETGKVQGTGIDIDIAPEGPALTTEEIMRLSGAAGP